MPDFSTARPFSTDILCVLLSFSRPSIPARAALPPVLADPWRKPITSCEPSGLELPTHTAALLCSGLSAPKDSSCSAHIFLSRPFTIFIALLDANILCPPHTVAPKLHPAKRGSTGVGRGGARHQGRAGRPGEAAVPCRPGLTRAAGQGRRRKPCHPRAPGDVFLFANTVAGLATLGPLRGQAPAAAPAQRPPCRGRCWRGGAHRGGAMAAPRAATPGPGGGARKPELDLELGSSTQTSHRLLAYSDALLSIIATVMVSAGRGELRGARAHSGGQRLGGEGRGLRPACDRGLRFPALPSEPSAVLRCRAVFTCPSPALLPEGVTAVCREQLQALASRFCDQVQVRGYCCS